MTGTLYVGLSCTGHENAVALVDGWGEIRFAQATERHTQCKRAINIPPDDPFFLPRVIEEVAPDATELVVALTWSEDAKTAMAADSARVRQALRGCRSKTDRAWFERVLFQVGLWDELVGPNRALAGTALLRSAFTSGLPSRTVSYPHHLTHAAYASFTSEFDEAVVAVFDGYGEGANHAFMTLADGVLTALPYEPSPRNAFGSLSSLGLFYGHTICSLFGFDIVNGEEWKVMGLAAYGNVDDELRDVLRRCLTVDGLDLVMPSTAATAYRELQAYAKRPEQDYLDVADVARTAQEHFTDLLLCLLGELSDTTGQRNLVLTGGCALNSLANGQIEGVTGFDNVYIPPAPSDDGNAVGAALLAQRCDYPESRPRQGFHSPYLGSRITDEDLVPYLANSALLGVVSVDPSEVADWVAAELAAGRVVGWVQGRAEFGHRALGNRSLLGDPRRPEMKERINAVIKRREPFRPFAPAILDEHGPDWFEHYVSSPYMERALSIRPDRRVEIPAVCHADGTGRLQSVRRAWNPEFHAVLERFHERTGVPVLLNTSLNVMGKPIVHSAADAIDVYLSTDLDVLVVNSHVFAKRPGSDTERRKPDAQVERTGAPN
jgi:carbamoyltransferase